MSLEFIGISHAYGKQEVLSDIQLRAEAGEITCLLGPSGCGKTTLLKLAAGLLDIQAGEVRLGGEVLADRHLNPPPERRPVGLVFQEGALFPHMSVAQNIAFGMTSKDGRDAHVRELLMQVGLPDFGSRYPGTLSGGQQQRIALARALAPKPKVLLLDEPFAAVDIVRRRELRETTRRVLKQQGATAVLVTHDPEEAMEMADQIAVMQSARIVQIGVPHEVYASPASAHVGSLFGHGQILSGEREGDSVQTGFGVWSAAGFAAELPDKGRVDLLVRPEAVELSPGGAETRVVDVRSAGAHWQILVSSMRGDRLWVRLDSVNGAKPSFAIGDPVSVMPRKRAVFAFPASLDN